MIKAVTSQNLDQRADEVKVVLASSCGTAMAISKLCDDSEYFYSDAVMLARSFIEKVINYCYLQVCEEEEFNNFIKHTIQKSYRRLYRSIKVGDRSLGVKLEQKIDTDSDPVLKDSLEAFTSKRGREITHWTKKTLEERIECIDSETELNIGLFMMNTLSFYEDASESLHGTLYGCSYHTWVYEVGIDHSDPKEILRNTERKVTLLLWQLGLFFQ